MDTAAAAHLAQRVAQAEGRAAEERQRALAHAVRELARRARLGRLSEESGNAGRQAAGQQDGAAQQVHLAQDLVQLVHCLAPAAPGPIMWLSHAPTQPWK